MDCLKEKWELYISAKPKFRGCIFIRVQHRKPTYFIMKIYGHNHPVTAQEIADVIITEHNAKVDAEKK